jgi:SAM-dependent methyltransferase
MPLRWIDVTPLPFNCLLLLERVQLSWFPGWLPEKDLAVALQANPVVEWYFRHKCPAINPWVDQVMAQLPQEAASLQAIRQAELAVLSSIEDLLVYALDPAIYDSQPFLGWDSNELLSITDFSGKTVIDVGSGTGRLAQVAAPLARAVFAVEPIANLRFYIKDKFQQLGYRNVYPVDGLITDLPFPNEFADICMGGHVFGDQPNEELAEMCRVTRPDGQVIFCPGTNSRQESEHQFLVSQGFDWAWFDEPTDGPKRKYWKSI